MRGLYNVHTVLHGGVPIPFFRPKITMFITLNRVNHSPRAKRCHEKNCPNAKELMSALYRKQ